ncbi:MAG: hypothetical protein JWR27_821 [Aeromicrobium sp.]|nr:hypothetical protein [Aeromicrobium sp.]
MTAHAESTAPHPRVRKDLIGGAAVLTAVIGGHLLWFVSDAGILAALG